MDALVGVEWLARHLGDDRLRILDCSVAVTTDDDGRWEFHADPAGWEAGHIPGSAYADLRGAFADPDSPHRFTVPSAARFAAAMGALGVGEGTNVVLYDRATGSWAARLWWMLRAFGFDDAAVLDGGLTAWRLAGEPLVTDPPAHPEAKFVARPRPGWFAGRDEVLAAIGANDTRIVDTLDREAYAGERLAYERRGHIPGAVNLPLGELNDPETMEFLSDEALDLRIGELLGDRPRQTITYCGSGIAAAAAAFTMHRLGYREVSVYDGGMEEWSLDPALPLEAGTPPIA